MDLNPKTIPNNPPLIRQKQDAASDRKPLHIAARHGRVDMRDPVGARGIYRVPPQGVTS